jgi:hypothetical protein
VIFIAGNDEKLERNVQEKSTLIFVVLLIAIAFCTGSLSGMIITPRPHVFVSVTGENPVLGPVINQTYDLGPDTRFTPENFIEATNSTVVQRDRIAAWQIFVFEK